MASCATTGLWADPTVPHRGWQVCDCEVDPEMSPFMRCQMCGSGDVPDGHLEYFRHPDHASLVAAGECCAHFMEVGPDVGRVPEAPKAAIPDVEADRKAWAGHPWRDAGWGRHQTRMVYDFVAMLYPIETERTLDGGHPLHMCVYHPKSGHVWSGRRRYLDIATAKAAAFDAILWARRQMDRIEAGEDMREAERKWANH